MDDELDFPSMPTERIRTMYLERYALWHDGIITLREVDLLSAEYQKRK